MASKAALIADYVDHREDSDLEQLEIVQAWVVDRKCMG